MKLICAVLVVCFLGMCLGNDPKSPIPQAIKADKGEPAVTGGDPHRSKDDNTVATDVNKDSKPKPKPTTTTTPAPTTAPTTAPTSAPPAPPAPTPAPPAPTPAPPAPTPAPPAPTPAPPAPTPAPPTPAPAEYGIGSWNVTDNKGHACILLKGDIEMNLFNETNKDNKVIKTYRVPKNAQSHGNCSEECIMFELPNGNSLHLMFTKNDSKFYIHAIKANLSYTVENKTKTFQFANGSLHLFETSLDQSYYCAPASENLIAQEPMIHLTLKVSDFQVQAYKNSSTNNFDSAENCEASHTPDVVPIVVGCLLALLVILVLVAYLISRRRSQSRGYISM